MQLDELSDRLRAIFKRYGILRGIVFGSFARGEESRHSDVDLFLIQATDQSFLKRYDGILRDITQAISERDVDVLIYTPQELTRARDQRWIAHILKEGKVIYESERQSTSG